MLHTGKLLEGNVWNEDYSINYTFGEAKLYPAGKQQWSELLDHQLGLDTGNGRRIAYVDGNDIRIPDRTQGVAVYTTDGRLIYQEAPAPADFYITSRGLTIPCQKGIYIVRVGPHTIKLPIL